MLPTYMFPNYLFIYFFVFSTFSYSQDKLFPEHCLANYNVNDSKLLKGIKDDFYNAKFLETPEESYNLAINTLEKAKINNDIELQIYCYRLLAIIGHNENKLIEALNYITEAYRVVEEYGIIASWKLPLDKDGKVKKSGITGRMAKKILKAFSGLVSKIFSAQYDQSAPNATAKRAARKENERLHGKWQVMLENLIKVFDDCHIGAKSLIDRPHL